MNALGRIGMFLLMAVLAWIVLAFSLGAVSHVTILQPSFFKSTLESSGIYETTADAQAELLFVDADLEDEEISAASEELKPYFRQVLTPRFVQGIAEDVIDSIDDWLHDRTPTPEFVIDTGAIRNDLNVALAEHMKTRIADLPPCTGGFYDYDPLASPCRPTFAISDSDYMAWADDLTGDLPLLDEDQLTSSIAIEDPDAETWEIVPRAYWWNKVAICIFAGLLVLFSVLAIVVSTYKDRVLNRLGGISAFNAVVLLVAGAVSGLWVGRTDFGLLSGDDPIQEGFVDDILLPVINSLASGVGKWMAIFGAIWAVIAIVCFVVAHALKRGSTQPPAADAIQPTVVQPR